MSLVGRASWTGLCVGLSACFPGPLAVDEDGADADSASPPTDAGTEVTSDAPTEVASDIAPTDVTSVDIDTSEVDIGECNDEDDCGHLAAPCTRVLCLDHTCGVQPTHGESCDDGDPCTSDDLCSGFTCAGEAYHCDDGVACTADVCDGEGGCDYPAAEGFCHIADACIAVGTPKPGEACKACLGGEGWSPDNGAACDDGDPCTAGDECMAGSCVGGELPDDAPGDWARLIYDVDGEFYANIIADSAGALVVSGVGTGSLRRDGAASVAVPGAGQQYLTRYDRSGAERPVTITADVAVAEAYVPLASVAAIGSSTDLGWATYTLDNDRQISGPGAPFTLDAIDGSYVLDVPASGDVVSAEAWKVTGGDPQASVGITLASRADTLCASAAYVRGTLIVPGVGGPLPQTTASGVRAVLTRLDTTRKAMWAAPIPPPLQIAAASQGRCLVAGVPFDAVQVTTPTGTQTVSGLTTWLLWFDDVGRMTASVSNAVGAGFPLGVYLTALPDGDAIIGQMTRGPVTIGGTSRSSSASAAMLVVRYHADASVAWVGFVENGAAFGAVTASRPDGGLAIAATLGAGAAWKIGDTSHAIDDAEGVTLLLVDADGALVTTRTIARGAGPFTLAGIAADAAALYVVGSTVSDVTLGAAAPTLFNDIDGRVGWAVRVGSAGGLDCVLP